MIVRRPGRSDLLGIGRVAEAAYWASYADLLPAETIGRIVARDCSPSALGRNLLRGGMYVASLEDDVIGFGDATVETDRIQVSALTTDPLMRRRGVGSALLRALRQDHEALAVATDVLLGHFEAEQFLEANGFVPGEIRQGSMFGIEVIERRWWNDAVAESRQARGAGGDR